MRTLRTLIAASLILLAVLSLSTSLCTTGLDLSIATNKPTYALGEKISIGGNLTLGGVPVSDGLVTLQVDNPRTETTILRTLSTGTIPPGPWVVEITDFYTCDASANPKTNFTRGGILGFTINLKNNAGTNYAVIATVYVQYSDNTPFIFFGIFTGIIETGRTLNATTSVQIPADAPKGTTLAYASVLTGYPKDNGYSYSPEKNATFYIETSSVGPPTEYSGNFGTSFHTNPYGGMLGNHTVYASSQYSYYLAINSTTFKTTLLGDITGPSGTPDGKVDVRDVSRVAKAYGSYPGHARWDAVADITGPTPMVPDGVVDVRDVSLVARHFGEYGTFP
ncbi:hypothetical protein MUP01_02035 [Candidatus Bathyarchaeota archaeon]|nr:hypothetical protein [Candidatus Bathyarchaeota archaeon]